MKKITTAIIAVLFVAPIFAQITVKGVDKRVIYNLQYQLDSNDVGSMRLDKFVLRLSSEGSLFSSESRFTKDSIFRSATPTAGLGGVRSAFNYTVIKKGKQNTMLHNYALYKFQMSEKDDYEWEIGKEEKEILGYKCQKATTYFRGRQYEAWFASDIPIFDGPYKFADLPGLILELYDTRKHYHFTAVSIYGVPKQDVVFDDSKYETVTPKQFKEFLDKVREKPSLIVETPKMKLPQELLDDYDKRMRERNKIDNNPIELTDK